MTPRVKRRSLFGCIDHHRPGATREHRVRFLELISGGAQQLVIDGFGPLREPRVVRAGDRRLESCLRVRHHHVTCEVVVDHLVFCASSPHSAGIPPLATASNQSAPEGSRRPEAKYRSQKRRREIRRAARPPCHTSPQQAPAAADPVVAGTYSIAYALPGRRREALQRTDMSRHAKHSPLASIDRQRPPKPSTGPGQDRNAAKDWVYYRAGPIR